MKILSEKEQLETIATARETREQQALLDQYAGRAMQGMLSSHERFFTSPDSLSVYAWNAAEAMLKERNKRLAKNHDSSASPAL